MTPQSDVDHVNRADEHERQAAEGPATAAQMRATLALVEQVARIADWMTQAGEEHADDIRHSLARFATAAEGPPEWLPSEVAPRRWTVVDDWLMRTVAAASGLVIGVLLTLWLAVPA